MKYLLFAALVGSYAVIGEGCHFPGISGDGGGAELEAPWRRSADCPPPDAKPRDGAADEPATPTRTPQR